MAQASAQHSNLGALNQGKVELLKLKRLSPTEMLVQRETYHVQWHGHPHTGSSKYFKVYQYFVGYKGWKTHSGTRDSARFPHCPRQCRSTRPFSSVDRAILS